MNLFERETFMILIFKIISIYMDRERENSGALCVVRTPTNDHTWQILYACTRYTMFRCIGFLNLVMIQLKEKQLNRGWRWKPTPILDVLCNNRISLSSYWFDSHGDIILCCVDGPSMMKRKWWNLLPEEQIQDGHVRFQFFWFYHFVHHLAT